MSETQKRKIIQVAVTNVKSDRACFCDKFEGFRIEQPEESAGA